MRISITAILRWSGVLIFLSWQLLFLFIPFLSLIVRSVHFNNFFSELLWLYRNGIGTILLRATLYASATAFFCTLLGYITVHRICTYPLVIQRILLLFLFIPFTINFVVHLISWTQFLSAEGIVGTIARYFHYTSPLLYTSPSVIIVFIYCYFPYVIFPLYQGISKINPLYTYAAADLGASKIKTITNIVIPLCKNAIIASFFIVFIPAAGEFLIPELIGGDRFMHIGSLISYLIINASLIKVASATTLLFILFLIAASALSYILIEQSINLLKKM